MLLLCKLLETLDFVFRLPQTSGDGQDKSKDKDASKKRKSRRGRIRSVGTGEKDSPRDNEPAINDCGPDLARQGRDPSFQGNNFRNNSNKSSDSNNSKSSGSSKAEKQPDPDPDPDPDAEEDKDKDYRGKNEQGKDEENEEPGSERSVEGDVVRLARALHSRFVECREEDMKQLLGMTVARWQGVLDIVLKRGQQILRRDLADTMQSQMLRTCLQSRNETTKLNAVAFLMDRYHIAAISTHFHTLK